MLTRAIAAGVAALLLGACQSGETEAPANEAAVAANTAEAVVRPAPAAPPAAPAKAAEPVLTSDGFGPLRIGMTRAEVVAALGEDAQPEAVGGPDPDACDEFRPGRAPEGMLLMIEAGRLTRISLIREAKVGTDRGVGLGATAAAVRAAYGPGLRAELHKYEAKPAEYLTWWAKDGPKGEGAATPAMARGLLYEVGGKGTVQRISAGGPSIRYVEGCA
jgi:hypothetical protein